MKLLKLLHILIFILAINTSLVGQDIIDSTAVIAGVEDISSSSDNLVEQADQAYRNQNYKLSIDLLEDAVAQGLADDMVSPQIYFNLGNSYFRDGRLGKAILNYERALLLDPGDGDIRHNLRFANNRKVDRIIPSGELFLINWFNALRNLYSSNVWGIIAIVLFILLIAAVAIYLFVRVMWARKSAFYTGIVLFFLVIITNVLAFSQKNERIRGDSAIIMVGAAGVNASPDTNSNLLFELHEGTKVRVRSSDGNWYEVEIDNGSVGWTLRENVEII